MQSLLLRKEIHRARGTELPPGEPPLAMRLLAVAIPLEPAKDSIPLNDLQRQIGLSEVVGSFTSGGSHLKPK